MVEAPCSLSALYHWDFLPHVASPGMWDFCVTRQEQALALGQALQCCMERLGMPVLSCTGSPKVHDPLMWLDSDEIVEASLLGPTNDRPVTPPTKEEEAVLQGG